MNPTYEKAKVQGLIMSSIVVEKYIVQEYIKSNDQFTDRH